MKKETPTVVFNKAHYLKGHASWLYCDECNKTVAYLCYVTYRFFRYEFVCTCGNHGWVENKFDDESIDSLEKSTLVLKKNNNRYCCDKDESPLFSPVMKNIESYEADVVCKECNTRFLIAE